MITAFWRPAVPVFAVGPHAQPLPYGDPNALGTCGLTGNSREQRAALLMGPRCWTCPFGTGFK